MQDTFPYYTVDARDTLNVDGAGYQVELRIAHNPTYSYTLPGVTEEDIINVLRNYFAGRANTTVTVARLNIASTPA